MGLSLRKSASASASSSSSSSSLSAGPTSSTISQSPSSRSSCKSISSTSSEKSKKEFRKMCVPRKSEGRLMSEYAEFDIEEYGVQDVDEEGEHEGENMKEDDESKTFLHAQRSYQVSHANLASEMEEGCVYEILFDAEDVMIEDTFMPVNLDEKHRGAAQPTAVVALSGKGESFLGKASCVGPAPDGPQVRALGLATVDGMQIRGSPPGAVVMETTSMESSHVSDIEIEEDVAELSSPSPAPSMEAVDASETIVDTPVTPPLPIRFPGVEFLPGIEHLTNIQVRSVFIHPERNGSGEYFATVPPTNTARGTDSDSDSDSSSDWESAPESDSSDDDSVSDVADICDVIDSYLDRAPDGDVRFDYSHDDTSVQQRFAKYEGFNYADFLSSLVTLDLFDEDEEEEEHKHADQSLDTVDLFDDDDSDEEEEEEYADNEPQPVSYYDTSARGQVGYSAFNTLLQWQDVDNDGPRGLINHEEDTNQQPFQKVVVDEIVAEHTSPTAANDVGYYMLEQKPYYSLKPTGSSSYDSYRHPTHPHSPKITEFLPYRLPPYPQKPPVREYAPHPFRIPAHECDVFGTPGGLDYIPYRLSIYCWLHAVRPQVRDPYRNPWVRQWLAMRKVPHQVQQVQRVEVARQRVCKLPEHPPVQHHPSHIPSSVKEWQGMRYAPHLSPLFETAGRAKPLPSPCGSEASIDFTGHRAGVAVYVDGRRKDFLDDEFGDAPESVGKKDGDAAVRNEASDKRAPDLEAARPLVIANTDPMVDQPVAEREDAPLGPATISKGLAVALSRDKMKKFPFQAPASTSANPNPAVDKTVAEVEGIPVSFSTANKARTVTLSKGKAKKSTVASSNPTLAAGKSGSELEGTPLGVAANMQARAVTVSKEKANEVAIQAPTSSSTSYAIAASVAALFADGIWKSEPELELYFDGNAAREEGKDAWADMFKMRKWFRTP
ncbi:hypothetical protein CC80DRAFT_595003 [Byssothecium circinans]|uniref:Uncharacterized protein n=1 Tax=Byssothecium circinans TaxID=147558 RepID=A0A6A5TQQ4_9PLEO|nr:hypothetical protein CC80DRAFT_595003 [Byssothecium circinans]